MEFAAARPGISVLTTPDLENTAELAAIGLDDKDKSPGDELAVAVKSLHDGATEEQAIADLPSRQAVKDDDDLGPLRWPIQGGQ